jgi:hypothetical protein
MNGGNKWIRNTLLSFGGVAVAVALLFALSPKAWEWAKQLFGATSPSPFMGSGIRVVGGGVTVQLGKRSTGLSFSTGQLPNQFSVANTDAGTFSMDYVSSAQGGAAGPTKYHSPAGSTWTIKAYVNDPPGTTSPSRGVEIVGTPGTPPANGNVTFNTINDGDSFQYVPSDQGAPPYMLYLSGSGKCTSPGIQCQTLLKILVDTGGIVPDTLFCANGQCNIYIGAQ